LAYVRQLKNGFWFGFVVRVLVPLLFIMVALYWIWTLLWFVFVEHFVDVVACVVIVSLCLLPLFLFGGFKR